MSRSSRPRRRATLATLAAELKVSRTTVSNAYNRPDQLSPELRNRVLAAAKEMGYSGPDPVARSLRMRRADTVGLLLDQPLNYTFRDPAAVDFVAGVADACDAAGRSLLIVPTGGSRDAQAAAEVVNRASVDGFVAYSVSGDNPYLAAALERHVPVVVCDQPTGLEGVVLVGIDDRAAMASLAKHVLAAGHRQIGIMTMRLTTDFRDGVVPLDEALDSTFSVQRDRIQGIADVASDYGDEVSITVMQTGSHNRESGAAAARSIMEVAPNITVLVCTSDVLALGAMTWAAGAGVSVPSDLSITGFDGTRDAQRADLTTVVQPSELKGKRAGEILMSLPAAHSSRSEYLDTTLRQGSTLAPPRRRP
ncbi:LacI family DNA-binding transcriptional regulator [Hoyosella rhizosphaerae]|uniref:LacI family transcriptional regulator n=1 Tax=Hoyosella rhizosphaerae TaxID=1755582 RepID=A0A916XHS3_9ACTN|nr:LacI family DNA-binding transcriptional regulator [Hoyosella rhizosphaerae]MBN4928367.1 LacI family DNA-binding transcriptional regulator [Hoyosella rhizosphaerae]GGC74397.1 LacI family transcriptional regulator [Hoyosella rhizosphaerae]